MFPLNEAYLCPICKSNRERFEHIFKLAQEIKKDPVTGECVYQSDEWVAITDRDGSPQLDVRCQACHYVGSAAAFMGAARRDRRAL